MKRYPNLLHTTAEIARMLAEGLPVSGDSSTLKLKSDDQRDNEGCYFQDNVKDGVRTLVIDYEILITVKHGYNLPAVWTFMDFQHDDVSDVSDMWPLYMFINDILDALKAPWDYVFYGSNNLRLQICTWDMSKPDGKNFSEDVELEISKVVMTEVKDEPGRHVVRFQPHFMAKREKMASGVPVVKESTNG